MTNQDDIRVAEVVRYRVEYLGKRCPELGGSDRRGEYGEYRACRFCGNSQKGYKPHEFNPPPFISAPTYESDGIVLEWVQGQGWDFIYKFVCVLDKTNSSEIPHTLGSFLGNYKPGMYARAALLAIQEERGE